MDLTLWLGGLRNNSCGGFWLYLASATSNHDGLLAIIHLMQIPRAFGESTQSLNQLSFSIFVNSKASIHKLVSIVAANLPKVAAL